MTLGTIIISLFLSYGLVHAERLSLRVYTSTDNLSDNTARPLLASRRGYLWAATGPDLARFDGHAFRIYSTAEGWTGGRPFWMTETAAGEIYVGAGFGLYRLDPDTQTPERRFTRIELPGSANDIEYVFEDSLKRLWVSGRDSGYLRDAQGKWRTLTEVKPSNPNHQAKIQQAVEDRVGDIWLATFSGIHCFRKNGEVERYSRSDHPRLGDYAIAAITGPDGKIYIGFEGGGIARLARSDPNRRAVVERVWTTEDGLPSLLAGTLAFWKGSLWAGTYGGLARIDSNGRVEAHTTLAGIKNPPVEALLEDQSGSLWLGTDGSGLFRAVNRGFTNFAEADGLALPRVEQVLEDRNGEIIAVTKSEHQLVFNRFNGKDGFEPLELRLPSSLQFPWAWAQIALHSKAGEWWLASRPGPVVISASNISALSVATPVIRNEALEGIRGRIFRIFEDSRGGIWVSLAGLNYNHVVYLDPSTRKWRSFPNVASDGAPPAGFDNSIAGFAEDKAGNIWMGCLTRGLWRYRPGGELEKIDGLEEINAKPRHLHVDASGRLWIGTQIDGLLRVDDPTAAKPVFQKYKTTDGLSSNSTLCITSSLEGEIYVCTGRGVDRLNPSTGRIRTYTTADGLMEGSLRTAFRDRTGALWFGTTAGVSRFVPPSGFDATIGPRIVIQDLRVANRQVHVPAMGLREASDIKIEPHEQRLHVEYVAFDPKARYQHRLEGVNDWSTPSMERNVQFEGLSPGNYHFQVRAVNEDGAISDPPATVRFHVVPPVWRRWWFLALCAAAIAAMAYALHRYRMQQVLALDRVRLRIAADLHDDIGSSLSQVSMLGELARRSLDGANPSAADLIDRMATTSREAVSSMGDIVWSIHPHKDKLGDLVQRMRRYASDLLSAQDIELDFQAPPSDSQQAIPLEIRRDVMLIFKESISNAARHSGCTRVRAELAMSNGELLLRVEDDGRGIASDRVKAGHGLSTMRARAERLGAKFELTSGPGQQGTVVSVNFPT